MGIFSWLYAKVLTWSSHRHAPYYLAGVSFTEACIFPIPPDVMLASMGLAKPEKVWYYATLTTVFSVLGGIFGYFLGAYFLHLLLPLIDYLGYRESYEMVKLWFARWGFWIVFVAGFSPVPYKLFTIGAGAMHMTLLPFVLASFVARAARFFLVAGLLYLGGDKLRNVLRQYIDIIGWTVLGIIIFGVLVTQWF